MADAVTTTVLNNGPRNYVVKLTNISDGTGEAAVKKVDISTLGGPEGTDVAPVSFAIKSCEWAIQGITTVKILFDATSDDVGLLLNPGNGYADFASSYKNDPKSTGFTGDIMLTTAGAESGGTYDLTLHLVKKQ